MTEEADRESWEERKQGYIRKKIIFEWALFDLNTTRHVFCPQCAAVFYTEQSTLRTSH